MEGCAHLTAIDNFHCRALLLREREGPLQRLFSTFPSGRPGIGLLLLRAALGAIAVLLGALYLSGVSHHSVLVWSISAILLLSGAGLIVGFMTPLASLLVALCVFAILLSWIPAPPIASLSVLFVALLMVVTAVGLALLGPGAFSVDGRLFGRREIVIPPRSPEP